MTLSEIRKKVSSSKQPKWFRAVEMTLVYPNLEFDETYKGFTSIYRFISQQANGWNKLENVPRIFESSNQHFNALKARLENFINRYEENDTALDNVWRAELAQLERKGNFFTFDSVKTEFLIDIHHRLPLSFSGAYNYIIKSNVSLNDRNNFIGVLLAYEFDLKDKSEITDRRKKERVSLNKIRSDFKGLIEESETQLVGHLSKANKNYEEHVELIDKFKLDKEVLFNEWFEGTEETIGVKKKILDLERTYETQLKLKKPADYWKTRAENLKKEGWRAIHWLIGLVVFTCLTLYLLLWLTPEGMLLSFIKGNAQAIKWSIIYITFISFLAYGIRALNKVAFSSFHLARDAEEREQLTYVYLSLIKDSAVDEKDKNLIMQSLFSRADTGLLKDDSGPTMPNDFAGKIFGGK